VSADGAAVAGVILAGGGARRLQGRDKGSMLLAGRSLAAHVAERLAGQVDVLMLNVNGDAAAYADLALPVEADRCGDGYGPLAGILTGLEWAAETQPGCAWLASAPVDTPFLPLDMVGRFLDAIETGKADIAIAVSGGRRHPVAGLWPVSMAAPLRRALELDGLRKTGDWAARWRVAEADFAYDPVDPFFNINRPEDLAEAERLLASVS
jgi:molybdopterin-guanine dinucleotide biosynthesis protein A